MSRPRLVFDRKNGLLGVRRLAYKREEKEFNTNYVVDILDPINFKRIKTVKGFHNPEYNWHSLPRNDPRVQFWKLFCIIDSANWYYDGYSDGDGVQINEAYIENQHEIFEQIRKIFEER